MKGVLDYLAVSPEAQAYARVEAIAGDLAAL